MSSLNRPTASDPSTTGMSATTTTTTTTTTATTTTTTTGKKKFGKNLNKLTKPPAPPAASEHQKANAASRNGLLLLSTNKRTSTSATSNGLLASKPSVAAPLPSLGLQYESTTSTHDVLLGAVVGAAASRAEQTPDAWGVNSNSNNNQTASSNGGGEAEVPKSDPVEKVVVAEGHRAVTSSPRDDAAPPSSNWDEYGGRGATGRGLANTETVDGNNNDDPNVDSQHAHMAKLARERAERRRQEEATRSRDQKEKAAQRLRALESKMEGDNVVLEPLAGNDNAPRQTTTQRTLYDPNRTYSSLVGGRGEGGGKGNHHNVNASGGASIGSREEGRGNGDLSPKANATPGAYSGPVIHLNSYEDRDRGEAPRPAAPRMLFDPKSGSMVAVPSRDDNPRGGDKGRQRKRGGNRGKTAADEDTGNNNCNSRGNNSNNKQQSKAKNGKKGSGKERAGKNSTKKNTVVSDRKLPRTRGVLYARDDKGNCYCSDGCDGDLGYGAHSVHGGRIRNADAYAKFMEQQQQLYKEQVPPAGQQERSHSVDRFEDYEGYNNHHGHNPYQAPDDSGAGGGGLNPGFSIESEHEEPQMEMDWVKPNEKIELVTGMDEESPTLRVTAREWAPSQAALAAAAQAAALPSLGSQDDDQDMNSDGGLPVNLEPRDNHAANVLLSVNMSQDEDDDVVVPSFIGLGFDPTENMDSVIQSPSAKIDTTAATTKQLDGVDFGAFSLEAPLCGITANNHNHIFAFGSSATWGTGGDSNDWSAPMLAGSSNAGTISGSRLFGGVLGATAESGTDSLGEDNEDDAFLSLTTGIPGFLGAEDDGITSGD